MNAGKLHLKWEDFAEEIRASYKILRKSPDFSDVTLVCEDGIEVETHKIILSACSYVFANILQSNKHPNTLFFMRGFSYDTISNILDFMYYGEVNIEVEQLKAFLSAAEDLKLNGISSINEPEEKLLLRDPIEISETQYDETLVNEDFRVLSKKTDGHNANEKLNKIQDILLHEYDKTGQPKGNAESIKLETKTDFDNLDLEIKTFVSKIDGILTCNVCGKQVNHRPHINDHVESKHMNLSIPCSKCGHISRSRGSLRKHCATYCK